MSFNDTLSDGLTRIRNAVAIKKPSVEIKHSKFVESCVKILKDEGFINDYKVEVKKTNSAQKFIIISLRYYNGESVINKIRRVSKLSRRVYCDVNSLPMSLNGLGCYVMSTNRGVMSSHDSRKNQSGGEVLFEIY